MKIVHRNLLLPLFSDPLDPTGEPDNSRSLVDPKETMSTQVAVVVSAIASHVHNLSANEGAQVKKHVPKGTEVCYSSVSEILRFIESGHSGSI